MRFRIAVAAAVVLLPALVFSPALAQQSQDGPAESIGERIDRGLGQLRQEVQKRWADVRQSLDELGVQGRVYGRLRWDKALVDESIEIDVEKKDTVVLTGRVGDEEARQKAVQLAQETVGVREVVDRLEIEPRPAEADRDAATAEP